MTRQHLSTLFKRNFDALQDEIIKYPDTDSMYALAPGIYNSGGNLCLHILGNLNHFIGANLGETGYVRKREEEFSTKGIAADVLLKNCMDTSKMVDEVINKLSDEQLHAPYANPVYEAPVSMEFFLFHLLGHMSYHLGQINYHRRILTTK